MLECAAGRLTDLPPTMAIIKPPAPRELAWRVLGLLNLYRLLVPLVLAFLHWVTPETTAVGWARPRLFVITDTVYFAIAIASILALKQRWPSIRRQAWLHIVVDVTAITLLLYSSGGVSSGLGMLLVLPVGADQPAGAPRVRGRRLRRPAIARAAGRGAPRRIRIRSGLHRRGRAGRDSLHHRLGRFAARRSDPRDRSTGAPARRRSRQPGGALAVHRAASAREHPGGGRRRPHPAHQRVCGRDPGRSRCSSRGAPG